MNILLLILPIFCPILAFPFPQANLNCKPDYHNLWLYTNQTLTCLTQGQVLFYPQFTCHSLHSQGPCVDGSRLIFSNSPCAQTVCRAYTDQSGQSCLYPNISHHGQCKIPADAAACGNILGRRLVPDLFGDYTCQCDKEIGFVDFNGSCHAEFLQGPCQKGEQVLLGEEGKGAECVKNICNVGKVVWSDGKCYPYTSVSNLPNRLQKENRLTREEIEYLAKYNQTLFDILTTFSSCTFCNLSCKTDSNGRCLLQVVPPKVAMATEEELLRLIREMFPDIMGESTTVEAIMAENTTVEDIIAETTTAEAAMAENTRVEAMEITVTQGLPR